MKHKEYYLSKSQCEYSTKQCRKDDIHVIEKAAYDKAIEALKFYYKGLMEDERIYAGALMNEENIRVINDLGQTAKAALEELGEF